jgi:D-tyrosyl-tRNA(Tyr) deacylase
VRAVVQRVARARAAPGGEIGHGLCVLIGVARGDGTEEAARLAGKVVRLRIFPDAGGRFDRSVVEAGGAALVVSQFTLMADTAKGNRPSFAEAAPAEQAEPLYEHFCAELRALAGPDATGVFGTKMDVELVNDGPVTLLLET